MPLRVSASARRQIARQRSTQWRMRAKPSQADDRVIPRRRRPLAP